MNTNEILDKIKEYLDMGKLSVFVGAGVSRLSEFPSWNELVKKMADELKYSYIKNSDFTTEELLKIPQMFYLEFGEEKYHTKVRESFDAKHSPNEIHDLILSLQPNHIMTTNYDSLLEETAITFGRNFSIINSNESVATAKTQNYLIKVHGYIPNEEIKDGETASRYVLKEQDYLDYEKNFILIDNLVKTIFATNLVVFIGYGLNDYNIKLILNWVKNAQSKTFVNPIFIYTNNEELSPIELSYQNGRGLDVLDTHEITESDAYEKRYRLVLLKIILHKPCQMRDSRKEKLQYMYNKIEGIKNLVYIRRKDFNTIFKSEYQLDDNWNIKHVSKNTKNGNDEYENLQTEKNEVDYFEDFINNEQNYKDINSKQWEIVKKFLSSAYVLGLSNDKISSVPNFNISSPAFLNDFNFMNDYCQKSYECLYDNYKKAYYFAQLGKYKESYTLFTDILKVAKFEEQWDIYYFSQLNRQSITVTFCTLLQEKISKIESNHGNNKDVHDESWYRRMLYQMNEFSHKSQFSQLPYKFTRQYESLHDLCERENLYDMFTGFIENSLGIQKNVEKNSLSLILHNYDKNKLPMLETSKFLFDNMILFDIFNPYKLFVKISMIDWLKNYYKKVVEYTDDVQTKFKNKSYFTFNDILLISKNFNKDDLKYLSNEIDFSKIPFDDEPRLSEYITCQIENLEISINSEPEIEQIIYRIEMLLNETWNLLFISSYFVYCDDCRLNVIRFLKKMAACDCIPFTLCITIMRMWYSPSINLEITNILDDWMCELISSKINGEIRDVELLFVVGRINLISGFLAESSKVKAEHLSETIIKHQDRIGILKNCFNNLLLVVNDDAKKVIFLFYDIYDIRNFLHLAFSNNLPDNCDESKILGEFFDNVLTIRKNSKDASGAEGTIFTDKYFLSKITNYMFTQEFSRKFIDKYWDITEEYTFLLCPERFEPSKFLVEWVYEYSDTTLKQLKKSKNQKKIMVNAINKYIEQFDALSITEKQQIKLLKISHELQKK